MHIGYLTDVPATYTKAIDGAKNWDELIDAIGPYKLVANDAIQCAIHEAIGGTASWIEFSAGLHRERKKRFAGEEWMHRFADILMPAVMFHVSGIAAHFFVPWGLAYLRMKEAGKLKERNGVAEIEPEASQSQRDSQP